jgi:hypothetical protein
MYAGRSMGKPLFTQATFAQSTSGKALGASAAPFLRRMFSRARKHAMSAALHNGVRWSRQHHGMPISAALGADKP